MSTWGERAVAAIRQQCLVDGRDVRQVFMCLRIALTGSTVSEPMDQLLDGIHRSELSPRNREVNVGRATFKDKRGRVGSNPEVKPSGTGSKGSKSEHDGRENMRGGPQAPDVDPYWKKPADVLPKPKVG